MLLVLAGMSPSDDVRGMRMQSRNAPGDFGRQQRLPFDDDDGLDIDADFGPSGFGGNTRNVGGNLGPMRGNMEGMAGGMGGMAGGMGDGDIIGGMMMNRMGGMMAGGLMGGIGGMGGGGIVPVGLDGLSRLAHDMGQMNAMQGNLRGMAGNDGNIRSTRDSMERGRGRDSRMERGRGDNDRMERGRGGDGRMGRGRGSDGRMGRGGGPMSRRDASFGWQHESGSGGKIVHVSSMNQEVHNMHTHTLYTLLHCL